MRNITVPGTLKAGTPIVPELRSGIASILPQWLRDATGLLDFECVGARSSQPLTAIQLVTHPRRAGATALQYLLGAADPSPNWGASGQRVEVWPDKDASDSYQGTICLSWADLDPTQISDAGYAWLFQYHVGPTFTDTAHPDEGGVGTGLSVANGRLSIYNRYQGYKDLGPLLAGRELFAQLNYRLADANGLYEWRVSYDAPPPENSLPARSMTGDTLFGSNMYPKTGIYVRDALRTIRVVQTACVRRATAADARAAAGWDRATPPPPPTVTHSIAEGATLTGNITWTATAPSGTVVFTIDGARSWTENNPPFTYLGDGALFDTTTLTNGEHTFAVAAAGVTHSVTATVDNVPDPTPSPLNLTIDTVTATHVYVSWTPVPGAGYRFYVDGIPVSVTMNPDMHTTRFKRTKPSHAFEVRALEYGERDTVTWTSTP